MDKYVYPTESDESSEQSDYYDKPISGTEYIK